MTILLTGATGLVGDRLLPRLIERGVDCRALLRAGATVPNGATAIRGELFDPESLERAVTGATAIVHLAAVFRTSDTDLIWKTNLEGTRNLITAAARYAPSARFILASTSNVYGVNGSRPGREDDIVNPTAAYPASKLAAEHVLQASGLTWSILRFAFVYGDQDGHIESLPRLAAQRQSAFHPAARMSVIHHRDVATAVNLALDGRFDGHVVNIADDAPTTIYELFQLVHQSMDGSDEPLPNPWHLHVDNSLARRLGFRPTVRTVFEAAEEGIL